MTSYEDWFALLTKNTPRAWQSLLAEADDPRSRVIRIPTGYGKTLGVIGAWLYHRVHRTNPRWPRRLVWTLPMRVLAEQTADVARECVESLNLLWQPGTDHLGKVGVHLLMGGADPGGEWNLFPEENAILVGTQDMLLSRALNRGYAAARARWPLEFGLLNHDALWVLDEVQLMDVGLATSAQLQAFFDDDAPRGYRPRISWWMSATLQPEWLRSVDTEARHRAWTSVPVCLDASEGKTGLASISKTLALDEIAAANARDFATRCADAHRAIEPGEFGRITLVVCNTVQRACAAYEVLKSQRVAVEIELVHSRFRPYERASWKERFLERSTCRQGVDRIIVATQVVEAGVDISAACVVSELAPWSSLVQRFGRCARYGGSGRVVVVDRGRDDKAALPYASAELDGALAALKELEGVGISVLETYEDNLSGEDRARLYPYTPAHLLIRRELDELFDTTPDLTGADVDVSRFLRSGDDRDLSVFWLEVPNAPKRAKDSAPLASCRASREELCAVPFLAARDWLCGVATQSDRKPRLRKGVRAWVWDWIEGAWIVADRSVLTPGRVVCVASDVGGYTLDRGFDPSSTRVVLPVPRTVAVPAQDEADDDEDSEELSEAAYKTIATHNQEVGEEARKIATSLGLDARTSDLLALAGRWHDLGKAHAAFQSTITRPPAPSRADLAKAPRDAWRKPNGLYRSADGDLRRGFRHELASCLALFSVLRRYDPLHPALLGEWRELLRLTGDADAPSAEAQAASATLLEQAVLACSADEFDLLAYLVLCHHGKVRVSLTAGPKDQEFDASDDRGMPIRGVREGDVLPVIDLERGGRLPQLSLTLGPATLGLSSATGRSWRDRTDGLLRRHGPALLAWLEALLIAADRRASMLKTIDPLLIGAPR